MFIMTPRIHSSTIRLAIVAACVGLGVSSIVRADSLATLGDDKTMKALSDRGLDSLLDRMFDVKHTPEAQRTGMKALRALHELADPNLKLGTSARQRHVQAAVDGLSAILPTITDPDALVGYAGTLLQFGVNPDVNTLEYWGDNPVTEARLRPVAKTVIDLLDRASTLAAAQANDLSNKLGNNDPRADLWEHLDNLSHDSLYRKNMAAYYLELATDRGTPAGQKQRMTIAQDALKYLKDLDNADSNVMPGVRLMMGKLYLSMGNYTEARSRFDSIADNPKNEIVPPPNVYQQYEARYFHLVAELENKNISGATKGLEDLIAWQRSKLPTDKATQDGVAAAAEMMRYRIFSADAAQAPTAEARKAADDNAIAVLEKLKKDHPEFASIIYEQLMNRIPADKPVATLDPLILQGLMNKGIVESNKPEGEKPDPKLIARAIEAAQEIVARKDRSGISADLNDNASLLIPKLYDQQGKSVDAAEGYLNYAEKNWRTNLQQAKDSMDRAGYLILVDARKKEPDNVKLGPLYDRFLPLAIQPPFNHTDLAYAYGKRLRLVNKFAQAVSFFAMVPKDDPNHLNARYFEMLSLKDMLDTKLTDAERAKTIRDLLQTGDEVKTLGSASADPKDRFKAAHATLIAAELSVEDPKTKDPKRALSLLGDFESQVKGLPGEKDLLAEALFIRVNAFMDVGNFDEGVKALKGLLAEKKEAAGNLVAEMLKKLDAQYARADVNNDTKTMREVAINEAKLTGNLVDWANSSTVPEIHKLTYRYRVYDANTQRKAGTLNTDEQERVKQLQAAEKLYNDLLSPANHELFVAMLDQAKIKDGTLDPKQPDVAVQVGLAFAEFQLKKYEAAQLLLGTLLGENRLGSPTVPEEENGETKLKDNDTYWEANVTNLEASIAIARQGGPDSKKIMDGCQLALKQFLIRGGIPDRWADDFERVRVDILPDWKPNTEIVSPATQPAATVAK
jgi:hypothetical protein